MAKLAEKVYGEALFKVAAEEGETDLFLTEAKNLLAVLRQNPQFNELMKHPKVSAKEKEQVLDEIFKSRLRRELLELMELLLKKGRYDELPKILLYLINRIKEEKQIGTACVTTAVVLSDKQKRKVESCLLRTTHYKSMEIQYEVDETLIGGMIIRIRKRVVDSSIRTKLKSMQKQLLQISLGEMSEEGRCGNP